MIFWCLSATILSLRVGLPSSLTKWTFTRQRNDESYTAFFARIQEIATEIPDITQANIIVVALAGMRESMVPPTFCFSIQSGAWQCARERGKMIDSRQLSHIVKGLLPVFLLPPSLVTDHITNRNYESASIHSGDRSRASKELQLSPNCIFHSNSDQTSEEFLPVCSNSTA